MPIIKPKHVVSFSSEDLKHPADNLLKPETYFKWKSSKGGESQVSAVLQLEKATKIQAIDIGNNGSAFIEVLVGRSSWSSNEDYQVLLAASSFMTPADSKANKDLNRVRMFGKEHFTKTVSEEKWDLVKIVCTQPYNLTEAYGISFINIHSPPEAEKKEEKTVKLGRFKLKSNSDDEELASISSGSFFQRKLSTTTSHPTTPVSAKTMAAAVRDASVAGTPVRSPSSVKTKGETTAAASTKKSISVSDERRDEVAASLMQSTNNKQEKANAFPKMNEKPSKEKVKRKIDPGKGEHSSSIQTPPQKKIRTQEKLQTTNRKEKKKVAFNKVLNGVVFVLSGFENPERGNLRDLALSMGGEYMPSWNNRSTHLICAFMNTPKFHQVKGLGKIVKKDWIKECGKSKKRLPTKSFRMDGGGDSSQESSDNEDSEYEQEDDQKATKNPHRPSQSNTWVSSGQDKGKIKPKIPPKPSESESSPPPLPNVNTPEQRKSSSECDTEDELEKIRQANCEATVQTVNDETKSKDDDQYGGTTDDEEDEENAGQSSKSEVKPLEPSQIVPELPFFFENKNFLIYGEMDNKDRRLLKRYITAYSGTLMDYMSSEVQYVITDDDWDKNFDEASNENESLIFVRPVWVMKCHEKQKLVDHTSYQISKET